MHDKPAPRHRKAHHVGQKTVRFSDLSGEIIPSGDTVARIVIHEHPELFGSERDIRGYIQQLVVPGVLGSVLSATGQLMGIPVHDTAGQAGASLRPTR